MSNSIIQKAADGMWIYKEKENNREFRHVVIRLSSSPAWAECTNAEKLAWEEANKVEEPIEVEAEP